MPRRLQQRGFTYRIQLERKSQGLPHAKGGALRPTGDGSVSRNLPTGDCVINERNACLSDRGPQGDGSVSHLCL